MLKISIYCQSKIALESNGDDVDANSHQIIMFFLRIRLEKGGVGLAGLSLRFAR